MKTIQKFFIATEFLLCGALYSCQKQKGVNPLMPTSTKDLVENHVITPKEKLVSWLPSGTKIVKVENGFTETTPKGWTYVGVDNKGNPINFASTSQTVSCTCNNVSGQCRPFFSTSPWGTFSGCGGQCTNCTMKKSTQLHDQPIDIAEGGYYLATMSAKVLLNGESAPAVFDALAQLPIFKDALQRFFMEAYQGYAVQNPVKNVDGSVSAPKGHSIIGISIMGRGLTVIVPDRYAVKNLGYTTAGKASCSCTKGSCTLKDRTILGAGAVWCEGDCETCTLTTDSKTSGHQYTVSIPSYQL